MYPQEREHEYSSFSADDFLSDSFFIRSIKQPNNQTDQFWAAFLGKNPPNAKEFAIAKFVLLEINNREEITLSGMEQDELLDRIMQANKSVRKRRKMVVRRAWEAIAGVAAIVALVFYLSNGGSFRFGQSLLSRAEQYTNSIDFTSDSIKLILSENQTISSHEPVQEYHYNSENITTTVREIPKKESAELNQLIVPYGKMARLTLSDGTKMWVNAGTTVIYPIEFNEKNREIYVLGEVYLDVTADAHHPFVVKTGNFDVRVLGTKLNVSAYKDETENVVLISGSVKISLPEKRQEVILKPSEMFKMEDGNLKISQVDVQPYTSWVNGAYIFQDEKLDVVMKRLSKYYGKNIEYQPEVGMINCSGKLNLSENLDDILHSLSVISTIKYTVDGNNYKIYR
jgi:ferric-dicitrate binding protein FerR (iron transport regulator)